MRQIIDRWAALSPGGKAAVLDAFRKAQAEDPAGPTDSPASPDSAPTERSCTLYVRQDDPAPADGV